MRSLEAQTLKTVEYLFVDDGSSDRSARVLETFLALHPDFAERHKLISSTEKRGSAHGTILGIQNATGRYVIRCDADDYIEPDALQVMLEVADGGDNDVVVCPLLYEYPKNKKVVKWRNEPRSLNDFAIDTAHFMLCNKLISRRLIVDNNLLPFGGIDRWEDLGVVSRVMALKPRCAFIDRPLYHYDRTRLSGTLSTSGSTIVLEDHLQIALLVEQWFVNNGLSEEYAEFLEHLKFCAKVKMMRGRDKDVSRWKNTFPEVNGRIMKLRHVALHYRLLFKIVDILPASLTQRIADLF